MKILLAILTLAATALMTSCGTTSTPETRIAANPALYDSLPEKQKKLVSQGKLTKGMTEPAVFIAWGAPDRKSEGLRNDDLYQTWTYSRLSPRYSSSIYSNVGFGFGGHGRYGRRGRFFRNPYYRFGLSPRVHYHKTPYARVSFRNGKVREWERSVR